MQAIRAWWGEVRLSGSHWGERERRRCTLHTHAVVRSSWCGHRYSHASQKILSLSLSFSLSHFLCISFSLSCSFTCLLYISQALSLSPPSLSLSLDLPTHPPLWCCLSPGLPWGRRTSVIVPLCHECPFWQDRGTARREWKQTFRRDNQIIFSPLSISPNQVQWFLA